MTGDALSLALFPVRTGLNLSALLAIGFALHAALGVVGRDGFARLRWPGFLAAGLVVIFAGLRLVMLNAQMGDGTTWLAPDLFELSWVALGSSTMALVGASLALTLGLLARSRIALAAGAVLAASGFALTGHTQGLTDPGLAPPAVALHVLIAGFWVAAPLTLWPVASLADGPLLARLERFSGFAVAAIPLLVVLGVWLAWRLAGGFAPLFGSTYGRLLILKLVVTLGAMGIGALNKQVVTGKMKDTPAVGRHWLRRTLAIETTLFVVAIVAVSAATTIGAPGE